uniref:Peregrin protein n=1 Tax=Triatoma infestans TaxID=30076 RepID=A0A170VUF7_TRIIF
MEELRNQLKYWQCLSTRLGKEHAFYCELVRKRENLNESL